LEYSHHNYHLRNSIIKYGRENFIIKVEEYPNITLEELIEIEQGLLDTHYGNGLCYNLSKFATGGCLPGENSPCYGKKCYNNGLENRFFSPEEEILEGYILGVKEETRKKCSEAKKGENNPNYGRKWYNNGIENRNFSPDEEIPKGYVLGFKEETKKKLSKVRTGKIVINNGVKEKRIFPDQEIPVGYFLGRKPMSKEQGQKISIANTGRKHSEETILKMTIRVITSLCCYYSMKDALKELGISSYKFYKLFEKDSLTGFYIEKVNISL
jgi:hypothetical protein